ncbi:MAG TPA: dihydrodipicolinate synthase family protein [Planctomycetaceae bacterium]|nr:dihydrodipicolinate synthase family protein [Planctomycetaceae bacterium]
MAKPLDLTKLRTVHLVPLTAYGVDGRINAPAQLGHLRDMFQAGFRVFLPAAGTSEFHSLTADEIVELVRLCREACGAEALIFAPIGMQWPLAIDVATRSLAAGATGLLFMPFVHPYISDAGARDYIHAVLEAAPAPTLVYKRGAVPSDSLLLELAAHPQVVGVKHAMNEMHDFRKLVLADGGRIEWLCGSAERYAPFYMLAGSSGYTTGAGNIAPRVTLAMHAALAAGRFADGLRLQNLLLPIEDFRARAGDSYNISMLKQALKVIGKDFGEPRPPQRRLTPGECDEIAALLKPILAVEREM